MSILILLLSFFIGLPIFGQTEKDNTKTEEQFVTDPKNTEEEFKTDSKNLEAELLIGEPLAETTVVSSSIGFWDFFRMFATLIFIIALIYGLYFLLKKLQLKTTVESTKHIRILSTNIIGQNQNLSIVEVGKEVLLLGHTTQQISLIKIIEDEDFINELRLEASKDNKSKNFKESFKHFSHQKENKSSVESKAQEYINRLKK